MAGNDGWEDVPTLPDGTPITDDNAASGWEDVPMEGNKPKLTAPTSSGDSVNDTIDDIANDAINTAGGIAAPFTNPVGVAKGLYGMLSGAAARVARPVENMLQGLRSDPERASLERDLNDQRAGIRAQTFDQFVNDKDQKYVGRDANGNFDMGATLGKIGHAALHQPFSTGLDLATVAAPATSAVGDFATASRLPGLTRVVNAAQTVGKYTNPLTAVEKLASVGGKVASFPVSVLSGLSPSAQKLILQGAYKGGDAAAAMRAQLRGNAPMETPIDLMDSALAKIKSRGMTNYVRNENLWKQDPTVLNHQPIFDALDRAEARAKSASGNFVKDPLAMQKIEDMRNIVLDHLTTPGEPHNVASFDALKQRLGTVLDSVPPGSRSEGAVLDAYNSTKQAILDQTPGYAKAMKDYEEMQDKVRDIKRTFGAGNDAGGGVSEGASNETMLGKLQAALRDDVGSRYGYKRTMLDVLAKEEPSLPYAVAGQAAKTPLSRGLAGRIGELEGLMSLVNEPEKAIPLLMATSPRLVGETLNAAGTAGRYGKAAGFGAGRLGARVRKGYQLSQTPEANEDQPDLAGLLGNLIP